MIETRGGTPSRKELFLFAFEGLVEENGPLGHLTLVENGKWRQNNETDRTESNRNSRNK